MTNENIVDSHTAIRPILPEENEQNRKTTAILIAIARAQLGDYGRDEVLAELGKALAVDASKSMEISYHLLMDAIDRRLGEILTNAEIKLATIRSSREIISAMNYVAQLRSS